MRINTARTALAVAALLATTVIDAAAPASANAAKPTHRCTPTWTLVSTPTTLGTLPRPVAVTEASSRSVWIAGVDDSSGDNWVLHWDGSTVTESTPIPQPPMAQYLPMTASFADDADGWVLPTPTPAALPYAASVTPPARWHDGRWTLTPVPPSSDPDGVDLRLNDLTTLSADDAWAVGYSSAAGKGVFRGGTALGALVEHWDGTAWAVIPNPLSNAQDSMLSAVTAVSSTDVWAVGRRSDGVATVPLAEHWDGTAWTVVATPTGAAPVALKDVTASGPDDVWAVGAQTEQGLAVPLVEHWDGAVWTIATDLPDLGNAQIDQAYAAGANDMWAIVEVPDGANAFLHWDGTAWSTVPVPGPRELGLRYFYTALSGTGPDDIWAVGAATNMTTITGAAQIAHLGCGRS